MNELGCDGTRTGKSITTQPISCFPTSRALACMGFRLARCLFPQYSALAETLLFRNIPPLRARDSVWPPCITEKSSSLRTPRINEMVLQVRAKRNPIHARAHNNGKDYPARARNDVFRTRRDAKFCVSTPSVIRNNRPNASNNWNSIASACPLFIVHSTLTTPVVGLG